MCSASHEKTPSLSVDFVCKKINRSMGLLMHNFSRAVELQECLVKVNVTEQRIPGNYFDESGQEERPSRLAKLRNNFSSC